jgi:replicative DNA helicase
MKDAQLEQPTPYKPEMEKSLLGCLLIAPKYIGPVAAIVEAADFYNTEHQAIYQCLVDLHQAGKATDMLTVADELNPSDQEKRNLLRERLSELMESVPSGVSAVQYAERVLEASLRRDMIRLGNEFSRDAYDESREIPDIVAGLRGSLNNLAARSHGELVLPGDAVRMFMDDLDKRATGQSMGLSTSYDDLDYWLGGIEPGQLIVVAGRPGIGKTTLMLNVGRRLAEKGNPVGIISIEMSIMEMERNLLAAMANVSALKLRQGHLSDTEWNRVNAAGPRRAGLPLYICDAPGGGLQQIRRQVNELLRTWNVALIAIDHLHAISHEAENEYQRVSHVVQEVKSMAREFGTRIILGAQFSRESARRGDARPRMTDMRGSGKIEEVADVVLVLHRELKQPTETLDVHIDKQRSGPLAKVALTFFTQTLSIGDQEKQAGERA